MDTQNIDIIELLRKIDENDYKKNVDLHIHSNFSDGLLSPQEILQNAQENNYELIAISDHNTIEAYKNSDILLNKMILPAIEFDCWYKCILIHILGYGVDVNNVELLSYCARSKKETEADWVRLFNRRHPKDIIKAIHNAGGVAVLAHPACYWAVNLEHYVKSLVKLGLDGLEVFYPYRRHRGVIKFHRASSVKKIATKLNLLMTGGSDSHKFIEKIY